MTPYCAAESCWELLSASISALPPWPFTAICTKLAESKLFIGQLAGTSRTRLSGHSCARSWHGRRSQTRRLIVIEFEGTHRLLQPDVKFKDLGLVIVDEEQRFGVRQKETLKAMRADGTYDTLYKKYFG